MKCKIKNCYLISCCLFFSVSNVFAQTDGLTSENIQKVTNIINAINKKKSDCKISKDVETDQWISAGFENPEIKVINPENAAERKNEYTHVLKMSFVVFRDSGWTEERVQNQLSKASKIYEQCGIKLGPVKLVVADHNKLDISIKNGDDELIARKTPLLKKPIVYFIRSNLEGQIAGAWTSTNDPNSSRGDTVWLTEQIDNSYKKFHDPSYNVLAHEIGHILCSCSHEEGPEMNLMAGTADKVNGRIRKDQCQTFKKNILLEKIR